MSEKDIATASIELSEVEVKGCIFPAIPIYPVRYGLSINYLKNIREKGIVSDITPPTGMYGPISTTNHQIMQLRQGFVYIYAHTKHRLFSTDKKGKWLVFRYITHKDDINSGSEFENPGEGVEERFGRFNFLLYKWGKNGANGIWEPAKINHNCVKNISAFNVVFVDKYAEIVDIAYSEYAWSAEIFEKAEEDEIFRRSVMTTIDIRNQNITEHTAPLKDIDQHVLEFAKNNSANLSELTKDWHTRLSQQSESIKPTAPLLNYKKFGLIVALEDVVGEMHELQKATLDLANQQADYYAKYLYPITIGNIIDPKIAYDIRGLKYPLKEDERVIAQKGVKKSLIPEFNSKMSELLKEPIESYEKPMEKLVKQIGNLWSRVAFKRFIETSCQVMIETGYDNVQGKSHSAYCFLESLKDGIFAISCTQNGIAYLEYLFGVPLKNESPPPFLVWVQQSLSKGLQSLQPIVEVGAKGGFALREKWATTKRIYKGLNDFLETGLNVFGQSAALYKSTTAKRIFELLGIDIWGEPEKAKIVFESLKKALLQESKTQLSQLSKNERTTNTANKMANRHLDFSATHRKTFLWRSDKYFTELMSEQLKAIEQSKANFDFLFNRSYGGILNFIAIYSGIIALNDDLTVKNKMIKTNSGKWTTNPALVRTTAIMDVAVASINLSHASGMIGDPTGFTLRNRPGSVWQAIKSQPLKFGYAAVGVLGGVLTAIVAWGGIDEALANNDKVSVTGYSLMFGGALAGAASIILGISKLPYIGQIISIIVLVGTIIVIFFGDSSLVNWVKNGFWGNETKYYYWNNQKRLVFDKQIEKAMLLSDQKYIEISSNLNRDNQLSEDSKEYLLIQKGFEDEVYGYFIQFGLQITLIKKGRFKITCAEFWRTQPNFTNINIICHIPYAKSIEIEHAELTPSREVVFSLAENGIRQENIRIEVTFTDSEGDEFSAEYVSDDYWLQTMM